jgi:hypothetical protein
MSRIVVAGLAYLAPKPLAVVHEYTLMNGLLKLPTAIALAGVASAT